MNFIYGELIKEDNQLYLQKEKLKIFIPEVIASKLKGYKHKNICFGIRPEDIYDSRYNSMAELPVDINSICELVEPLGNEYMVYVKADTQNLTARFDPKALPEIDKSLKISMDMAKAHFFDIETEIALT